MKKERKIKMVYSNFLCLHIEHVIEVKLTVIGTSQMNKKR